MSILKPLRYKVDLIGGSRAQVRFKKHFYRVRKSDLRSLISDIILFFVVRVSYDGTELQLADQNTSTALLILNGHFRDPFFLKFREATFRFMRSEPTILSSMDSLGPKRLFGRYLKRKPV